MSERSLGGYLPHRTNSSAIVDSEVFCGSHRVKSVEKLTFLYSLFAALITDVAYGIQIKEKNDPYIQHIEEVLQAVGEASIPGRYLVDLFPAMKHTPKWLPGAGWKRKAEYYKKINDMVSQEPYDTVKRNLVRMFVLEGESSHTTSAEKGDSCSQCLRISNRSTASRQPKAEGGRRKDCHQCRRNSIFRYVKQWHISSCPCSRCISGGADTVSPSKQLFVS
jgi:hypothetical protein